MARRQWSPNLHPRGWGGRFASKGSAPANKRAAKRRGKLNRATVARNAVGVATGAATIATGHFTGNRTAKVAGVARIGLAVTDTAVNVKSNRRVTSKDWVKLPRAEKLAERKSRQKRKVALAAAGAASDLGLTLYSAKKWQHAQATRDTNAISADNWWRMEKAARGDRRDPFTHFQGPGHHRVTKPGKFGANRGVYNVTSEKRKGVKLRKEPRAAGRARRTTGKVRKNAAVARRTTRK